MIRYLTPIAFVLALAGCQGIVNPTNGNLSGITVPPGCKAQGNISFPIAQGGISFQCDETGQPAPASGAHLQLR